nr:hypothetical protein [uncultured bacterium]
MSATPPTGYVVLRIEPSPFGLVSTPSGFQRLSELGRVDPQVDLHGQRQNPISCVRLVRASRWPSPRCSISGSCSSRPGTHLVGRWPRLPATICGSPSSRPACSRASRWPSPRCSISGSCSSRPGTHLVGRWPRLPATICGSPSSRPACSRASRWPSPRCSISGSCSSRPGTHLVGRWPRLPATIVRGVLHHGRHAPGQAGGHRLDARSAQQYGEWVLQPPGGKAALETESNRALTLQDHKEQAAAYIKLAEMLEKRGAEPAEREAIEAQRLKATRRLAAETFRQLPPAEALKSHPELAGAYAAVAAMGAKAKEDGLSADQRQVVMARTRYNVAAAIEQGKTPQVQVREVSQAKQQDRPSTDKELER